jgi:hypothetical protein
MDKIIIIVEDMEKAMSINTEFRLLCENIALRRMLNDPESANYKIEDKVKQEA